MIGKRNSLGNMNKQQKQMNNQVIVSLKLSLVGFRKCARQTDMYIFVDAFYLLQLDSEHC